LSGAFGRHGQAGDRLSALLIARNEDIFAGLVADAIAAALDRPALISKLRASDDRAAVIGDLIDVFGVATLRQYVGDGTSSATAGHRIPSSKSALSTTLKADEYRIGVYARFQKDLVYIVISPSKARRIHLISLDLQRGDVEYDKWDVATY
jgi:hypothetical protein